MKISKKFYLIIPALLIAILIYSFTKVDIAPPTPESSISIEQAQLDRSTYIINNPDDISDVTFDYDQVKKLVDLIEYKKSKGEEVSKIRIYMSQYENGKKTAFIAPVKKDGKPNYNISPINYGHGGPPPKHEY